MLAILLSAGHETTVNLISSGILLLLRNPEQRRLVEENPGRWPDAVEEVLRAEGPIQNAIWRFTTRDDEVGGRIVPSGEAVALSVASAARDESVGPHADEFRVEGEGRRHLAFGHGIHHCLGALLARLEGVIALSAVF